MGEDAVSREIRVAESQAVNRSYEDKNLRFKNRTTAVVAAI